MQPIDNGRRGALLVEQALSPAELRAQRRALALSQAALAGLLGVTPTTVARWERSEQKIGNPERLSAALARFESQGPGGAHDQPAPGEVPAERRRHNLPAQLSSLVGRDQDVADVKRLLAGTRLLTVTGTGGIGKTRLALQVAADPAGDFADGVWLVELAPLVDPALVARAVAATLEIREKAQQSLVETLADALADRQLLLMLDNCEHLIEACAELSHALLSRCKSLRVLATSREALGVPGETAWQLPPLALPRDDAGPIEADEVAASAAGRLFVERVRAAIPSFAVTPHNAAAIAEVCRRLDGVPLALELAAARVPLLGVGQIAALLDDRFRVLTGGSRTAPRRHQTLRAAVDWSYDQLSIAEQRLFNQLSVFAGGWTLQAAESVADESKDAGASSLLDLLAQLVAKSLVVAEPRPDGQVRYRQLQTLRMYAQEKLDRSSDSADIHHRHAGYYLGLAEKAQAELRGPHQSVWLDRLEADHDNLRFALTLYVEEGSVERAQRLGGALCLFWQQRGYLEEGWNWVARILTLPGADAKTNSRAKLLLGAALLAHHRADLKTSMALGEEALELSRSFGGPIELTWSLAHLGVMARVYYDYARARALFEEGLAVARTAHVGTCEADLLANLGRLHYLEGNVDAAWASLELALAVSNETGYIRGKILALKYLSEIAYRRGDYAVARSQIETSLACARELRDAWRFASVAGALGHVLVAQGHFESARRVWLDNLAAWRQIDNLHQVASTLEGFASLAASTGDLRRALRLAGAAGSIRRAKGILITPEARVWLHGWLPAARATLGARGSREAWAKGESMPVAEAIAYASDAPAPGHTPTAAGALTRREREVVVLVTRGLTDREIADALVMALHTAHKHVRNVLNKLGLRSRVQIAAWAVETGLSAGSERSAEKNT